MRKKISFCILSNSNSPVKQFTVSRAMFRFVGFLFGAGLVLLTWVIYDYCRLNTILPDRQKLKSILSNQSEEVVGQRRQIQKFADEITTLKSKLIALNDFEKKIRIIARIEKAAGQGGLFGVGGSAPADLDAKVPLTEKHNSLMREMHAQVKQLDQAAVKQKEGFESLFNFLQDQRNLLSSTPAIRPVKGWVTSEFGYRISPFTGLREFHEGLDIATQMGSPIIAPADGVVSSVGTKGLLGTLLSIDHGHGIVTQYGHVEKVIKKSGQAVKRGDIIAHVGMSGRTTGPHVHYEVLLNGIPVNPVKYILN